ncbi:MAG: hypothetical protein IH851_05450 [Armatimonadetes bacterium]|nr:hypothetical protein [Armatimonadota bacterium]
MALTVTRATIKEKCRITVTDFDTEIDNLITEQKPVIEFAILDAHVNDTSNTGLVKTLDLGAAEVVAGEFLAQAMREPGAGEVLEFSDVRFGSRPPAQFKVPINDPFFLKAQGWVRLAPYLKPAVVSNIATRTVISVPDPALCDEEV